MKRPLSYRERRFSELYAASGNGKQAYIDAGYSPNGAHQGASRLLSRVEVREAIEALKPPAVAVEDMISPAYVLSVLKDVAENGETDGARVQAAPQLGRSLGMFVDKQESKLTTSFADEIESLQDEIKAAVRDAPSLRVVK